MIAYGVTGTARVILPLEGEGWAPVAEGDWEDGVTNLDGGDPGLPAHADQPES
jgi:hypothetical protein